MTDLTAAQWREIEAAAVNALHVESHHGAATDRGRMIWCIELGKLRTIIKRSRRTNDQNALLWALYEDVLKQGGESLGGWTKDDLHEWALGEYFGWTKHTAFGRTRLKPNRRSSRLTKQEFADFLDWFVRKMAEHSIVLELPGEAAA